MDLGEDELWASTPAQYLERIFQIVLTLPPMEHDGYRRMIDDLVGVRATPPEEPTTPAESAALPPQPALASHSPQTSAPATEEPQQFRLDALPIVQRVDPLALTPDEHRLIGLLGPAPITAPRAVKRLANSYGLLVAISTAGSPGSGHRPDLHPGPDLNPEEEAYPYRAGMVLLAAVIGFPMLGPSCFPDLHHGARTGPATSWDAHLAGLRPADGDQGWVNRIESTMTVTRAQHWSTFLDALDDIGHRATTAGLPLPQRLDIWARWVVPSVGSFPTGSAVSRLTEPPDQ